MGNDSRVQLDSSKALSAIDELIEKLKKLVKYHEELVSTFATAYANDNLMFYSRMGKLSKNLGEAIQQVVKKFEDLSEKTVEHSNRMTKFSEDY